MPFTEGGIEGVGLIIEQYYGTLIQERGVWIMKLNILVFINHSYVPHKTFIAKTLFNSLKDIQKVRFGKTVIINLSKGFHRLCIILLIFKAKNFNI